jgi:DNA-binding MarR family transcriptional regulator
VDRGSPLRHDPIGQAEEHWRAHGWSDATPGMAFVTSVIRVQQLLLAEVDRVLKPRGLTFARYEVLMLLRFSRRGSMPIGKVGERLQVHPASVTNAVDRLEHDGLVRRVRHPDDGRSVLVELTTAGAELAADATDALNAEVFGALPIGPDVTTQVTALLRDVRRSFGDFT